MVMMRLCLALALVAASSAAPVLSAPVLRMRGGGKHFPKLPDSVHPGVLSGQAVKDLLAAAKEQGYAIPAVNCVTSSSINTVLEAAKKFNSPVMIQFSNGGSQFYAGKSLPNDKDKLQACVLGAVSVRPLTLPRSSITPPLLPSSRPGAFVHPVPWGLPRDACACWGAMGASRFCIFAAAGRDQRLRASPRRKNFC